MTVDHLIYIFETNGIIMPNKSEHARALILQLDGLPKNASAATFHSSVKEDVAGMVKDGPNPVAQEPTRPAPVVGNQQQIGPIFGIPASKPVPAALAGAPSLGAASAGTPLVASGTPAAAPKV